jgi:ATP adenylyltransferase
MFKFMEHLWSPWRLSYVTRAAHGEDESAAGDGNTCIFCEPRGPNADLVVYNGRLCYVILNLYPYNNGHLMVVPRRHIRDLASTTVEERAELMALARVAEIALGEAYTPHGINAGINLGRPAGAGVLNHLHIHLVPRWNGDTSFMSVVGNTRVLPEDLAHTAGRLRPIFERLSTDNV